MDSSIHNLSDVFRELSRLGDADHTIYLRTDSHNLFEIHRTGFHDVFISTVAAFMPNVVIKLQTPVIMSIIAAVPSRQGFPTLHTPSRLFIVERLSDIVNFIQHHKAAFIREDGTLAVWANEIHPALAALHQVLKELGIALDRHDLLDVVDPTRYLSESIADSNIVRDAFNEFIHDYDNPVDKSHTKSHKESAFPKAGRNTLLPLPRLQDPDTQEAMYTVSRTNLFDSLSSHSLVSANSPFLSSAILTDMSRLCLGDSSLQMSPTPAFSSLSFDSLSPSVSSSNSSDRNVLSTPLTIAPSVLSSPLSTGWGSPKLATISECTTEEPPQDTQPVSSVDCVKLYTVSLPSSDKELSIDTPTKRKRSQKANSAWPAEGAIPEKPRSRRSPRVPASPKTVAATYLRACQSVPKAIVSALHAPQRAICPLPEHTERTRSSTTSSTSSTCSTSCTSRTCIPVASKAKHPRAPPAQLTISKVTRVARCQSESELEGLESDDTDREYESNLLELDDDDDDYDDYRPAKRTRSLPNMSPPASPASSAMSKPVRRKAVTPKLATENKKASKKRKLSRWTTSTRKKKAKNIPLVGPPPTCIWCDKEFTRDSDVERHVLHACKLYPFERTQWFCSLCEKLISRTDAVIRHQGSDDCNKRQRGLRAREALIDKVTKKACARAARPAMPPHSPGIRPTRSVSL